MQKRSRFRSHARECTLRKRHVLELGWSGTIDFGGGTLMTGATAASTRASPLRTNADGNVWLTGNLFGSIA